jgi:alpha-maltose-1-phosphate synthase
MSLKVNLVHPGTQHSFYLASQLERLNFLQNFYTSFAIPDNSLERLFYDLLPRSMKRKYAARILRGVSRKKVNLNLWLEYKTITNARKNEDKEKIFHERNKKFQLSILKKDLLKADVIIGYDTSSWIIGEECKKRNKKFILEVTTPHSKTKQEIDKGLIENYPGWTDTIQIKDENYIELEQREMELADLIVVPSQFVKDSYIQNNVPGEKIVINSFGTDVSNLKPKQKTGENKTVTYLFFGSLTARKGLPFLLEVWKAFFETHKDASLLIAGYGILPKDYALPEGVTNLGIIAKSDKQSLFDKADVFVFPSFFEGLALVLVEAAACGLPIIGTKSAGVEELVTHGQEGLVISSASKEELSSAMKFFYFNRDKIKEMGKKAAEKVNTHFTWEAYGERWAEILNEVKRCHE